MKQKWYMPHEQKQNSKVLLLGVDLAHTPSKTHKFGAINNKSKIFDDRRKRKPKYKTDYLED